MGGWGGEGEKCGGCRVTGSQGDGGGNAQAMERRWQRRDKQKNERKRKTREEFMPFLSSGSYLCLDNPV